MVKGSFLFAGAVRLKLRICSSRSLLERGVEFSAQHHSVDLAAPSRDREKCPLLELLEG